MTTVFPAVVSRYGSLGKRAHLVGMLYRPDSINGITGGIAPQLSWQRKNPNVEKAFSMLGKAKSKYGEGFSMLGKAKSKRGKGSAGNAHFPEE
jgi:hypothetical protein